MKIGWSAPKPDLKRSGKTNHRWFCWKQTTKIPFCHICIRGVLSRTASPKFETIPKNHRAYDGLMVVKCCHGQCSSKKLPWYDCTAPAPTMNECLAAPALEGLEICRDVMGWRKPSKLQNPIEPHGYHRWGIPMTSYKYWLLKGFSMLARM